jgi:hypothetical protein
MGACSPLSIFKDFAEGPSRHGSISALGDVRQTNVIVFMNQGTKVAVARYSQEKQAGGIRYFRVSDIISMIQACWYSLEIPLHAVLVVEI